MSFTSSVSLVSFCVDVPSTTEKGTLRSDPVTAFLPSAVMMFALSIVCVGVAGISAYSCYTFLVESHLFHFFDSCDSVDIQFILLYVSIATPALFGDDFCFCCGSSFVFDVTGV